MSNKLIISEPVYSRSYIDNDIKKSMQSEIFNCLSIFSKEIDELKKNIDYDPRNCEEKIKQINNNIIQLNVQFLNITDKSDIENLQKINSIVKKLFLEIISIKEALKTKKTDSRFRPTSSHMNPIGELSRFQRKKASTAQSVAKNPVTSSSEKSVFQGNLSLLIKVLRERGIAAEGLFRLNGLKNIIDKVDVSKKLDAAELNSIRDINTIAGILKKILREEAIFEPIKNGLVQLDPKNDSEQIKTLVQQLSKEHQEALKELIGFLSEVAKNANVNKMTPSNLSVCIAPNLTKQPATMEEQFAQMELVPKMNAIFAAMIETQDYLFSSGPSSS